jgi:putative ATP-binding cassette transporter
MTETLRHVWSRVKTIARPFFRYESRWRAVALFGVLVVLMLSISGLNVLNSYVNKYFMTSLAEGEVSRFWSLALVYAALFVVVAVVASFKRFVEERLGLLLREGLTDFLIGAYLAGHTYQRLKQREDIDNPDQRIAEDVKSFTVNSLSFALVVLDSTIALVSFAGVLWSITPRLVLAAVLYAGIGTVGTILLGRRLVRLNFLQLKKEADFRFRLIQVRESGESIALQGAEPEVGRRLRYRFQEVVDNFWKIIRVNLNINVFINSFNYLTQIIPVLVVAPLFFRHEVPFGAITQAMAAFAFVLNAFTVIVTQFQQITSLAAVAERLGSLVEAIEAAPAPAGPVVAVTPDGPHVAFEGLTLRTPKGDRELVRGLNKDLPPGRRLLVLGPNGAGKSALFRAAAGLWPWGEGRIVRPREGDVMFLPQEPFLATGTLREQLFEGACCRVVPDERILQVLREIKFEKILKRVGGLDAANDWQHVLSPGEKRLVSFARLLLAEPKFAFIDAGIGGVTDFWVRTLYGALSRTRTTYVSVGDHPALREYHDEVLDLDGEGVWHLETCRVPEQT